MNPVQLISYYLGNLPNGRRLDANETAALQRQLDFVKSRTYDIKYSEMKARRFIPVSNEVNPGAESITYKQWDQYGMAKVVSDAADDLPLVDVVAKEFTSPVKTLGAAYKFTVQELKAAALLGTSLDQQRGRAARRAIEAGIDHVAALGLGESQMPGFLNHPNVPVVAPTTGTWATASVDEILADINKLVNSIVTASNEIHNPDTLLLPTASFALLASTPAGANLESTILKVFLSTNPYIRSVDQWSKLNTAGVGGGPRVVAYLRDPEIMQLEIPQEFEQLPPQPKNLAFVVPCHCRVGGTSIRYPLAMAYMDGV